ncbi:MAG: DMT family transporter [Acidimicrobiia bacterium]|nr:DMT family transporter [Acidimicrobiia bacterium]
MTRFIGLAGILTISWSAVFVVKADVTPITAAFFRAAYAIPVLLVLWLLVRERDQRPPGARLIAVGAGLFLAADLAAWHHAIDLIGAGLATVLANVQVVLVPLAAWIILREHPSRLALRVAPIVFVGVVLVSGLGRSDAFGRDPAQGIFFGALTAVFYTGFIFLLRVANRNHLAPASGPLLDATVGTVVGAGVLALFDASFDIAPSWPAHGWLLAIALVSQVAGWLAISYALPRLPAIDTSVLLLLQPAAAVLWARLVLSETPSTIQWAGVAVVLAGVGVFAALSNRDPATA